MHKQKYKTMTDTTTSKAIIANQKNKLIKQLRKKIKNPEKLLSTTYNILVGMASGMALMLLFWLVINPKPLQMATVDVNKIVDEFVKKTAERKLPNERMQKLVASFGNKLETTLNSVAKDRHLILLPKEAVISGAKDVTSSVQEALQ